MARGSRDNTMGMALWLQISVPFGRSVPITTRACPYPPSIAYIRRRRHSPMQNCAPHRPTRLTWYHRHTHFPNQRRSHPDCRTAWVVCQCKGLFFKQSLTPNHDELLVQISICCRWQRWHRRNSDPALRRKKAAGQSVLLDVWSRN